jgi:hypothetical protein
MISLSKTDAFERTAGKEDAVNKLTFPDDDKKEFIRKAELVIRTHRL